MATISDEANQLQSVEVEQKESLKLVKNTKGYNYEVKILEIDIKRLKKITDEIEETYNIKNG